MISFAVYRLFDGWIVRRGRVPYEMAEQAGEGEEVYYNCPDDATHIIDNQPVIIVPEAPSLAEADMVPQVVNAVQRHLDTTARTRNYDGILSLCSYATSTDQVFAAEGQAGVIWRDACWRTCYQGLAEVEAGLRQMPTPEEAVAELPPMEWPS